MAGNQVGLWRNVFHAGRSQLVKNLLSLALKEESGAILADQLEGHVEDQFPVFLRDAAEKLSQALKVTRGFSRVTPFGAIGGDAFWKGLDLGRLLAVVKKLVERDFESAGHFFERLDAGDSVAVLHTGDVTTLQAGALLDITLGEVFLLPDGA